MEDDKESVKSDKSDHQDEKKQKKTSPPPTAETSSDVISSPPTERKSKNLRQATSHLKEEALRRYRLKHQKSWKDWSPPNSAGRERRTGGKQSPSGSGKQSPSGSGEKKSLSGPGGKKSPSGSGEKIKKSPSGSEGKKSPSGSGGKKSPPPGSGGKLGPSGSGEVPIASGSVERQSPGSGEKQIASGSGERRSPGSGKQQVPFGSGEKPIRSGSGEASPTGSGKRTQEWQKGSLPQLERKKSPSEEERRSPGQSGQQSQDWSVAKSPGENGASPADKSPVLSKDRKTPSPPMGEKKSYGLAERKRSPTFADDTKRKERTSPTHSSGNASRTSSRGSSPVEGKASPTVKSGIPPLPKQSAVHFSARSSPAHSRGQSPTESVGKISSDGQSDESPMKSPETEGSAFFNGEPRSKQGKGFDGRQPEDLGRTSPPESRHSPEQGSESPSEAQMSPRQSERSSQSKPLTSSPQHKPGPKSQVQDKLPKVVAQKSDKVTPPIEPSSKQLLKDRTPKSDPQAKADPSLPGSRKGSGGLPDIKDVGKQRTVTPPRAEPSETFTFVRDPSPVSAGSEDGVNGESRKGSGSGSSTASKGGGKVVRQEGARSPREAQQKRGDRQEDKGSPREAQQRKANLDKTGGSDWDSEEKTIDMLVVEHDTGSESILDEADSLKSSTLSLKSEDSPKPESRDFSRQRNSEPIGIDLMGDISMMSPSPPTSGKSTPETPKRAKRGVKRRGQQVEGETQAMEQEAQPTDNAQEVTEAGQEVDGQTAQEAEGDGQVETEAAETGQAVETEQAAENGEQAAESEQAAETEQATESGEQAAETEQAAENGEQAAETTQAEESGEQAVQETEQTEGETEGQVAETDAQTPAEGDQAVAEEQAGQETAEQVEAESEQVTAETEQAVDTDGQAGEQTEAETEQAPAETEQAVAEAEQAVADTTEQAVADTTEQGTLDADQQGEQAADQSPETEQAEVEAADKPAEDGQAVEGEQTVAEQTAESGQVENTAEQSVEGQAVTAEPGTETAEVEQPADQEQQAAETAGDQIAEGGQTVEADGTAEGDQAAEGDQTAEGGKTVEGEQTAEGDQTADTELPEGSQAELGEGQVEQEAKPPSPTQGDAEGQQEDVTEKAETEKGEKELAQEQELAPSTTPGGESEGETPQPQQEEDEEEADTGIRRIEEEERIPEDFYYNYTDHVSKPVIAEESGLPEDLLTLDHSFGYDCQKRSNLYLLDENTVCFVAGNLVQLLNLKTKEQLYIRSTSGGAVGALAVHPSRNYFAIAEKGEAPNIIIYEYPSLKLYRILRGGTETAYSFVDFSPCGKYLVSVGDVPFEVRDDPFFRYTESRSKSQRFQRSTEQMSRMTSRQGRSPDGKLLASVGSEPDFMLTIWNWKQEAIVLRSKAFSQDIFRVSFSTELEGQLTSSGTGHIRFWKMANTFTGLKLQGEIGKFGKTEISDIEGYVELPDGKVLSGSEGGNMLLWDGGLIKVEIGRKNRKPCHNGVIQQIVMDEGELMTVGIDGCIRVWDFESIDTADVTDDSNIYEMEPMNELKVGTGDVQLRSIIKSVDPDEPTIWFAQDARGGIWKLDLSFSHTSMQPEKLMSYHAGSILACDTSPNSHLVATCGQDQSVRVYDYLSKNLLSESKFNAGGSSLLWAPQVVDPKGSTIIAGFDDGVVRILHFLRKSEEDTGKKTKEQLSTLILFQAFKPHNTRVTSVAVDSRGEILATGSEDGSVFFLTVGNEKDEFYNPIGYIKVAAPITHMQWSPSKFEANTLLVFMNNGHVTEIECPDPENFDSSKTFEITGLNIRNYQFASVKSKLRHEEELERKAKEEAERKQKEEEERQKRIERGLETESEHGDEEKEKKDAQEEEWEPFIPEEPCPILYGFYGKEEGTFWLSMGDFDAGYLYQGKFSTPEELEALPENKEEEPIQSVPVLESGDIPISCIKFSTSGRQVIMGMEDGSVRIQPIQPEDVNDLSTIGPHWTLPMHDNNYGKVTSLAMSYDSKFLFTVGDDGNFFTYQVMDDEKMDQKVKQEKAKLPSARKELEDRIVDDIDDPKAYSIEDARQKAEYDRMMKLAEEKKQNVRKTIAQLRLQFKKLLEANDDLPKHLQLNRAEFEMDPEIKKELEKQTGDKIDLVGKEMAWEAEKCRIALEKLRQRFKDAVECERIVVKAFQSPHELCSYRASKLSDDFYQLKAAMERRKTTMLSRDEMSRDPTKELIKGQSAMTGTDDKSQAKDDGGDTKVKTTLKGSMGERITKALNKVEEKKKKRALRRAQWNELYGSKPDDNYEDPADVAAIKEAQENMGDYKLKTADDYVVPDHLRMNAEKARNRLLVLKDLIHQHKYEFNEKLLALRDKKINIIEEIKEIVVKLTKVQSKVTAEFQKPLPKIPELHKEEVPERKLEYTKEMLMQFKSEMEERELKALKGPESGFGGAGTFAPQKGDNRNTSVMEGPAKQSTTLSTILADTKIEETPTQEEVEMTLLEMRLRKAEQIRLKYDQDTLLERVSYLLRTFDAELLVLRHDKFKMDMVMKNADLRHVTLFEELVLLKEFEKRENVLAAKVEAKQQEKMDMQAKVLDCQQKLDNKRKDIEKYQDMEKNLYASFLQTLGENNKFADYLTKVFKKKIKRAKKKTTEGDDSDDESDEESDDESDWSDEDEESDSEAGGYDLDVCPPQCEQSLYDNTCQLREKRLDIEEALSEEKKINETLKKELESLTKRAKIIDSNLKTAENDLEAFQLEKQRKLNELDIVVSLKLHQIQHVINGVLPQDLSQCLVFEAPGVVRLQKRIKELEHEKNLQKKQQKEAKRKHVQLIKDRKTFEKRIAEMEEQCNQMMLLKFGRIVDLEKLETVTVNRQLEELKEKLRQTELECATEMLTWEDKIERTKDQITDEIRENTNRLEQLNMLMGEKKDYEGELDSRQKNLGTEFSGSRKADIHERQRLIQLVQLQAQEIEALKDEITLLSHKGGHILPPAQPPLPGVQRQVTNP